MKPTLLLLAAGMRKAAMVGWSKLDELGSLMGRIIMDYSIYDAIQAGFGKIVLLSVRISRTVPQPSSFKVWGHIPAELFPEHRCTTGFSVPERSLRSRQEYHAVLMAKDVIKELFCVINCDDFYSNDCFKGYLASSLADLPEDCKRQVCVVGLRVGNTEREWYCCSWYLYHRCWRKLTTVVERTEVRRRDGESSIKTTMVSGLPAGENTPVSMNVWGFTPDYFEVQRNTSRSSSLIQRTWRIKSEYFIPLMVNKLIPTMVHLPWRCLTLPANFGVTYAADRQAWLKDSVTGWWWYLSS